MAKIVFAKQIGKTWSLFADVERRSSSLGCDHVERFLAELVQPAEQIVFGFDRIELCVEVFKQPLTPLDFVKRNSIAERNSTNIEFFALFGNGIGLERSVFHTQVTGTSFGFWNRDERRKIVGRRHLARNNASIRRIVERWVWAVAGKDELLAKRMGTQRMRDATHDRELVGAFGQLGQMFADLDPRYVRFDRVELTSKLRWSIGLEIKGVDMRRAARKLNENRSVSRGFGVKLASVSHAEIVAHRQPAGCAKYAHSKGITTAYPVTLSMSCH